MNTNILSAVMNIPQWVVIAILAVGGVIMLLALVRLLYILIYKPELKAELRTAAKAFREQKRKILADKELAETELRQSEKEIEEKAEKAKQLNSETERLRQELVQQGLQEEEALKIAEMTLDQLLVLKGKERKDLSGNYIINAITRKVLIDSEFERRSDVEDFKVPVNVTTSYTADSVEEFVKTLFDVTHERKGKPLMDAYAVLNKSFAMLIRRESGFLIKVKCGTYYGQRLTQLYPQFFTKAKFPSGMLWFDVHNRDGCSLELVRLLIAISYNIAKAGY